MSQTQNRRRDIIDRHHDGNPAFWDSVEILLESLGGDGMSSDESESEGTVKKTRRVRKGWISPEVSQVWQMVERYHNRIKPKNKRGNMGLERDFAHHHTSIHRIVAGLPKNYYDNLWWQSLSASEQANLDPQPPKALPDCSVCVAIHLCLLFLLMRPYFTSVSESNTATEWDFLCHFSSDKMTPVVSAYSQPHLPYSCSLAFTIRSLLIPPTDTQVLNSVSVWFLAQYWLLPLGAAVFHPYENFVHLIYMCRLYYFTHGLCRLSVTCASNSRDSVFSQLLL